MNDGTAAALHTIGGEEGAVNLQVFLFHAFSKAGRMYRVLIVVIGLT